MTSANLITDCRFCSIVSKSNGEDPIGTAYPCDTWLIMEVPLPWTEERFLEDCVLHQIHDLLHEFDDQEVKLNPMAIAPDPEYSIPGFVRVFHYQRPVNGFAQFDKQEFLVPETQLFELANTLLKQPNQLYRFEAFRQPTNYRREIMVCTHGNVDVACARFGYPIYQTLRQEYAAKSNGQLRVWRCSHFGGHQFAPTLVDLPTGHFWGHLEPNVLDILVQREQPVTALRQFYRGWSGLTKFEQIVEREIWMQKGWEWLNYSKYGQVLAQDSSNKEWDADWAEIRLNFTSPDGEVQGAYEARVEVCDHVMTAINSGNEQPLQEVKQYRVSRLTLIKSN